MAIETGLPQKASTLIAGREAFMREASVEGGFYRKSEPVPHFLLRGIFQWVSVEPKLRGSQNLDFIKGQLGQSQRVTIAPNHLSDADHPALEHALMVNGFDWAASRLVFAAGLKMWDRPQTSWGVGGLNAFPVAPPGYFEEGREFLKSPLNDEDRKFVEGYLYDMALLNRKSFEAILPDWKSGKAIVVVYPETTRSRNGLLQKGRDEMIGYLRHGLILPVRIDGTDGVFPPGRNPYWEKILRRECQVSVSVNEPINAERLKDKDTRQWLQARGATPVDFVMSRIAVLNPERVDSKYRPLYDSLSEGIPEGIPEGLLLKAA